MNETGKEEETKLNDSDHDEPVETDRPLEGNMVYQVDTVPPFYLTVVLALQQVLMTITGSLSLPLILAEVLCAEDPGPVRAKLCAISLFLCGLATILQCTVGIRLPIIQGGSHTFLPPVFAMLALDQWRCPVGVQEDPDEAWMSRMREIQGNLMLASLTQVTLGCTGLLGFLMRFIGPLTVAPTIALVGLSLTGIVAKYSQVNWGIAFLTVALVVIFSLLLGRFKQPLPAWSRQTGCHVIRFPLLQLFSLILAMCIAWVVCYTLTVSDVLPSNSTSPGYYARTDIRLYVLYEAPWFSFPYPFQFGMPTVSAAGFFGMLAATLASIIESVGDYFAAARACETVPPPSSAINRAVAIEGLASIFSGMFGAGHATTSYSGNAGAVILTKVASRRVFQTAGVIMLLCGILAKLGAAFSLIPDPIVGGALGIILAMVTAIGVTTVLHANMTSVRNMAIFGLAITFGLSLPQWVNAHPESIDTGNKEVDQILIVLTGTPMCVGGFIGCFLDNIVPGTVEERGISRWRQNTQTSESVDSNRLQKVYDLPYVSKFIRKIPLCTYVPISPSYQELSPGSLRGRKSSRQDGHESNNGSIPQGNCCDGYDVALEMNSMDVK